MKKTIRLILGRLPDNRKKLKWLLILLFVALSTNVFAQVQINGTVKDLQGRGLPGVSISDKNGTVLGITNVDGAFAITTRGTEDVLVFSSAGFIEKTVSIQGQARIDVVMDENVSKLDEVIVIGYGQQSREKLTTSVSKLDNKTLENIPYTNVLSAVQGSIPGVRVQSWNGQPGVGPRIILRGGTTINNPNGAAPLYLVDGVIKSNLDDIAADDVESLQVLKDAAATSIYGARASNGVVLVTTRSAKAGLTRVNYSYDISVADPGNQLREYVGAEEYIRHARQSVVWTGVKLPASTTVSRLTAPSGYGTGNDLTNNTAFTTQYLTPANQHKLNEGWQSMPDPIDPSKTIIFKETDFQKLTYRNAISHNNFVSVAGGTEKVSFNGSLGYLRGQGIALNSDYNRFTVNLNSALQATKKLRIDGRVLYSTADYRFITADPQAQFSALTNTFYRSPSLPATAKYQFEDGTMAPGINNSAGNPHYYQIGPFAPKIRNNRQKLTISIGGKWDIIDGLYFEPLLSSFEESGFGRTFQPGFLSAINTFNTLRRATESYSSNKSYQADAVLTYLKSISEHNLEAKVGYSYYSRYNTNMSATGEGAATDLIPTLSGSAKPVSVSGPETQFLTEGVFGRVNYDYMAKYLLSLTARYDGASNLGAKNRFGFFPGVGLGWNVHKENFWSVMPPAISNLKLRLSYGENGNIQNLSEYGWQGIYNVSGQYDGASAIVPGSMPNEDLQWEETRVLDGGLDLGLFNNRISLIFDYYSKITENLITNVVLPGSSGFGTVQTNNGRVGSKGIEVELNGRIFPAAYAFQWTTNFNIATVSTKVLKLPDNGVEGNRQGGVNIYDPALKSYVWRPGFSAGAVFGNPASYMEGHRIGDMYAYKQIGVYATDEEAAKAPTDMSVPVDQVNAANGRKKYGGDVIWADLDGNNIIDSKDQVYVGNMFPNLTGGFSNYFNYKGISLSVRTDFAVGHTIYNYARAIADGQLQGDLMPTKAYIQKSWKKQGDVTDTPRYLWQNSQGNITRNSTYYEKGDFLALREISLGYRLPSQITDHIRLKTVRVNVTGSNLHYFTKFQGPNPEDGGADNGRYPNPRTITFGLNVTF